MPTVSVVIPTRDEGPSLDRCVESILQGDYPLDRIEILIVNGGTDEPLVHLERWKSVLAGVHLIQNIDGITPIGINLGLRAAQGRYVLLLGAHSTISSNYISGCVTALRNERLAAAGGITRAVGAQTWIGQAIAIALSSRFGVGNAKFRYLKDGALVDTVAFAMYPREVFEVVGSFDERLIRNQDIEFNYRARRLFGPMRLLPSLHVNYFCRRDLLGLCRQNYLNGLWNVLTWRLIPNSLGWRHFVPLGFVLALCFGVMLGVTGYWLPITLVLALYFSASLFATAMWVLDRGVWAVLPLPLVFLCLHLSYGIGSLSGIMRLLAQGGRM